MDTTAAETTPIAERLSQLVQDNRVELPPYPEVVLRLRQLLEKDEASAGEVGELIVSEPALSTQVQRACISSARFASPAENCSLSVRAVTSEATWEMPSLATACPISVTSCRPP